LKSTSYYKLYFKSSVVAAALCATAAAHAQSSVTLYGIADAGLMYLSHSTPGLNGSTGAGRQFLMTNSGYSPSLWGLMGSEDLGGGLKATFKLESGISFANGGYDNPGGNNGLFNRTAEVGLSSNRFGTVTAGLQFSPFFLTVYDLDPRSGSEFGSAVTPVLDNSLIAGLFMPNSVSYTSPNISGFEFSGLFGFGGVAGNFQDGRSWSVSAKYTNGTFLAGAGYISVNNAADTGLTAVGGFYPANVRAYTAGASYKFGGVTVKAAFANFKANSAPVTNSSTDTSVNVYSGGADWFVLPDLDLNGGVYYQQDRVHSGSRSITAALGTQYFLSKQTALYAQVGFVNNKCSADGQCLGSGLTVESGGSGIGGLEGDVGSAAAGAGLPPGTTFGGNVGIRVMF
jgi:predicted porin